MSLRAPGMRGPPCLPGLVLQAFPQLAVPPSPRLCPLLILPAHHQVPAPESHLPSPVCTQSYPGSLGYHASPHVLRLLLSVSVVSSLHSWCLAPPRTHPQQSQRITCANTSGRRPGPGWGDVWAQRPDDLVVRDSDLRVSVHAHATLGC